MKNLKVLVFIVAALAASALADQVTLKNGDRISGTIVRSDEKELVIKSEFAGDVTVQWPAIVGVNSSSPLHVKLNDGQTVVGEVQTTDGQMTISPKSGSPVTIAKDAVSSLRNDAEQVAFDKTQHPGWKDGWSGGANVGFALTRGNSQTKNLAVAFTAARKTLHDKLGLYANSVYATNDAPGATPNTTANTIQGGARYDRDFAARLFGFVSGDFQTDDLQDLDLRSVLGGGLGFHAIKSATTTLDLLGGVNYTRENYTTFTRNLMAATLGEELAHKFGKSTDLVQKLYFYPDFNQAGEYRATFDFGTVTKLNKWLGWQNSFGDIYVTNPPAGKRQNDIVFTTGLNLSFLH